MNTTELRAPEPTSLLRALERREPRVFIGNEWVAASGSEVRATVDPSTGREFASYAVASAGVVDEAVRAAAAAQKDWERLDIRGRAECFAKLATLVEAHADELAMCDAINAGLPIAAMPIDIRATLNSLYRYPGLALGLRGEVLPAFEKLHYTRFSPYGVVAKIAAYNHPFLFSAKGCLAALITGNTVVLKPAEQAPMSAMLLGDLIREAFPPGVWNIVTGDAGTGEALVGHPGIRRIAFTGSAATGRLIQKRAAETGVKNVSLELGGKNPMIVFPDVDTDRVAVEIIKAMNLRANQGQSCGSTSRILAHEAVYDKVVSRLVTELERLRLGVAYEQTTDLGPLISERQLSKVRGYLELAGKENVAVATGGLDDSRTPDAGFFVAPTVLENVDKRSAIAQEEIFGPVISMFRWNDYDEMVADANDTMYGLTASIWTNDVNHALRLADEVEAGYVWINDSTSHYWGLPYGGWKESGVGQEESTGELTSYLRVKSVHAKFV